MFHRRAQQARRDFSFGIFSINLRLGATLQKVLAKSKAHH